MLENFTITGKYELGNANFKYNISSIPRHSSSLTVKGGPEALPALRCAASLGEVQQSMMGGAFCENCFLSLQICSIITCVDIFVISLIKSKW
jgi:hypothetical protein